MLLEALVKKLLITYLLSADPFGYQSRHLIGGNMIRENLSAKPKLGKSMPSTLHLLLYIIVFIISR